MNPTNDPIEALLDAWSVPELSADLSARALVRARATRATDERPARAPVALGAFVPAVLGLAATVMVADTLLKIVRIFGA